MNLKKYQTAGKKKAVENTEITKDLQSINVVPKDEEWKDGKIVKLVTTGSKTKRVQIGVYYINSKGQKVKGLEPVKGTIPRKRQTGGFRRYQKGGIFSPKQGITRNVKQDMFDPNLNINLLKGYSSGSGYGGNINPRLSIGPDRNLSFNSMPQSRFTLGPNLSTSLSQQYGQGNASQLGNYSDQKRTTLGGRMSFQSPIGNKGLIGGLSGEAGGVLGGSNSGVPWNALGNDAGYAQAQAGLGYYPRNSNLGIKGNIGYGTAGSTNPGLSYGLTGNYGPATFNVGKDNQGLNAGFGLSLPLGTRKRRQTGGMYGSNTMSAAGQGGGPQLGMSSTIVGQETDAALQEQRMQALAASGQSLGQEGTELSGVMSAQAEQDELVAEQMGDQAGMQAAQLSAAKASTAEGVTGGAWNIAKKSGVLDSAFGLAPKGVTSITNAAGSGMSLLPGAAMPAGYSAVGQFGGAGVGSGIGKFATSGAGLGTIAALAGTGVSMLSDDGDPTHSNVGEYTGSILSSAGTGAAIGSYVGPVGTAVGAVGGALWGAGKQFFGTESAKAAEKKAEKDWKTQQQGIQAQKIGDFNTRIGSLYGGHLASTRAGNLAQKTVSGQNLGRNVMYKNGGFMMGMPRYGYNN